MRCRWVHTQPHVTRDPPTLAPTTCRSRAPHPSPLLPPCTHSHRTCSPCSTAAGPQGACPALHTLLRTFCSLDQRVNHLPDVLVHYDKLHDYGNGPHARYPASPTPPVRRRAHGKRTGVSTDQEAQDRELRRDGSGPGQPLLAHFPAHFRNANSIPPAPSPPTHTPHI